MNIKKTLFAALLALGCMSANAQEEKTEYVFTPHWYGQAHVGGQYTLGEIDFGDLLSPNAQIGVGYNFNPLFSARLDINAWQSKGGVKYRIFDDTYKWKWNYINPNINATFDISNAICGYNPTRLVDVNLFAGIGLNIAWNNDEANDARNQIIARAAAQNYSLPNEDLFLTKYWKGTHCLFNVDFGADVDFRINDNLKVGLELKANTLPDSYNSKKARNWDWHFDALVGVKYAFGKTYTKKVIPPVEPQIIYKDRIVEKIVETPATGNLQEVKPERDPLRLDVFFTIASTKVLGSEAMKIGEIANYLKKYPEAKVTITGYADKGTGNATINYNLSVKRADIVANELIKKYKISADRIKKEAKGDTVQPFDVEVLNRVSICIAE